MKPSKSTLQLMLVVFAFTAFAGYSYMSAATTWTAPVGAPPNGNVDAPINVGTNDQIKNGGLGINALAVFGNGTVTGTLTSGSFMYSSDRTLKTNIRSFDGLALVTQLHGVEFDWKDTGKTTYGLIAQDVQKVVPELVEVNPQNGKLSVAYGNMVSLLIEAVKQQQVEIDTLKQQVHSLQSQR